LININIGHYDSIKVGQMKRIILKLSILIVIVLAFISIINYYHINDYLSLKGFNNYHNQLMSFELRHPYEFIAAYVIIYIALISLCIPGTILLDLIAGFIFGSVMGSVIVILSYSIGSVLNFLLIRFFFKDMLIDRFEKFKAIIHGSGSYGLLMNLIGLRLIAVIPFWILNIAAALLNVRLSTFLISTVIGIIPSSIIYAVIGAGVHDTFLMQEELTAGALLNPKIWLPIIFMAILLLLPNFIKLYKHIRIKNKHAI
jgi:uncharacterized membrane protein YdjX (TVP38/TMEM64 family)